MSRFHRLIHSIASGYLALIAASLYSFGSVPLVLHYLTKQEFALWALISTIGGYFALVDFGLSGAMSRLLVDHKDKKADGDYGSLIKTGWVVSCVQGLLIFFVGISISSSIAHLLSIETELEPTLAQLLRWQSAIVAFGFLTRILSQLLQVHQRMDIYNYGQIGILAQNFLGLWFFLSRGHGVVSVIWVTGFSLITNSLFLFFMCLRLRVFPSKGAWGKVSWSRFKEIFAFGKDIFFVVVGVQVLMGSQTIIITKKLGLEAAALWAVGTKVFNLLFQVIWRVSDFSAPALAEMIVRKEQAKLYERYKAIAVITFSLSGAAAFCHFLCNGSFVEVWTSGRFKWPPLNDLLLSIWLITLAAAHCYNGFVILTKEIGFMRYVYFWEAIAFVIVAWFVADWAKLPGIIMASVFCSILFSCSYGAWRVGVYFKRSFWTIALGWQAPVGKMLLVLIPLAIIIWSAVSGFESGLRLVIKATTGCICGCFVLLRYGLFSSMRDDLLARLSPSLRKLIAKMAGVK